MPYPYFFPFVPAGEEASELARLERLVHDLRRYADGHPPTPAELRAAPTISGYDVVMDFGASRLAGIVSSHPTVRDGRGVTSRVYAVDHDRGWARTVSRLWRLGRPANRDGQYDA